MFKLSLRIFVTCLTALTMFAVPMVSAASDMYASKTTQQEVGWDAGWQEIDGRDREAVIADSIFLEHTDSGAELLVAFVPTGESAIGIRDAALSSSGRTDTTVSELEAGTYGDVSYSVGLLRSDNQGAEGVFTLMISNSATGDAAVYVLITDADAFSDGVSAVQVGVTVDGAVAMNGVDPAGMQSFLTLAQSTSTQTTESVQVPETNEVPTQEPAQTANSGGSTYTSSTWGYTVEYSPAFEDVSDSSSLELMIASSSPVVVVGFMGIENPGAAPAIIYDALTPTFIDSLGSGGSYIDGGYMSDRVIWAGVNADGNQMVQQIVLVSPTTAVIVTIIGQPGVNMSTVGDVTLNGVSIFGN